MADVHRYPKLRPLESIVIQDPARGRCLMLRDTEGIAASAVIVPAALGPVLARFDGARSIAQIAEGASRALGQPVSVDLVRTLAEELDQAWMLDTPRFRARKLDIVRDFAASGTRPAAHAGGAYHGDASELSRYIEGECLGRAARPKRSGELLALCAPHMDLWRAPVGYGHAYQAISSERLDAIDTFVLLGTSHAPMRRPFALCEKSFDTPLGSMEPDRAMCAELVAASRFDLRADEYLHKQEHSLEFQVVFLRYLLGARRATIVPVLCGLGEAQDRRLDPARDGEAESFLAALHEACRRRGERVLLVAGADMAHVGPRFGDAAPLDDGEREALRARDHASLERAVGLDALGFFDHVAEDLSSRRVCGLGPIYTMLRALPDGAEGEVLHYAQHVDPNEGSIVSHASLGFYSA